MRCDRTQAARLQTTLLPFRARRQSSHNAGPQRLSQDDGTLAAGTLQAVVEHPPPDRRRPLLPEPIAPVHCRLRALVATSSVDRASGHWVVASQMGRSASCRTSGDDWSAATSRARGCWRSSRRTGFIGRRSATRQFSRRAGSTRTTPRSGMPRAAATRCTFGSSVTGRPGDCD